MSTTMNNTRGLDSLKADACWGDELNWDAMWWATKDSVLSSIHKERTAVIDAADAVEREHLTHCGFADRGKEVSVDVSDEVRNELERRGYTVRTKEGGGTSVEVY